jgi:hypothetical protein
MPSLPASAGTVLFCREPNADERGFLHAGSGETELMPGGSHHLFQDDIQEEDEEETDDETQEGGERQHDRPARRRRQRRRQRSEYRAEGTLAGVGVLAGICAYHSMALVMFAGASYPHLRARIGQHARDLLHPLSPSSRNRAEAPSGPPPPMNRLHSMHLQAAPTDTVNVDGDTWTSAAAAFDRVQAQDWAEVCLLAASLSFLFRQHIIAGLFLLTSLYPYLDAIIPVSFLCLNPSSCSLTLCVSLHVEIPQCA